MDCAPYARMLFKVTVPRLSDHVDHEIKECAITASGLVLAHLGHLLGDIHTVRRVAPYLVPRPASRALASHACVLALETVRCVLLQTVAARVRGAASV